MITESQYIVQCHCRIARIGLPLTSSFLLEYSLISEVL